MLNVLAKSYVTQLLELADSLRISEHYYKDSLQGLGFNDIKHMQLINAASIVNISYLNVGLLLRATFWFPKYAFCYKCR